MAIYHMEAKIVSRGAGRSACAASAYMSCSAIYNDYDGVQHDYTRKQGLVWQNVFLPEQAPAEWQDRAVLWNAVEETEKTKDSRLAREFVVALPIELSREQNISLLADFIQEQFVSDGMCADAAIHDTDGHNPHAHILLTVRPLNENGTWQYKTEKEYLCIKDGEELFSLRDGKKSCADALEVLKPGLERYRSIVGTIKSKTAERKELLAEKKVLPAIKFLRRKELSTLIAQLTEDLEELRSEKSLLLENLRYSDNATESTMRKEISYYEDGLKKLENQESKYSAELDAALQEYAEMKQQAEGFDPVELYRARKAIRPEKEADAENRIRRGFGNRFSFTRFWESRHRTDYDLDDYTDSERVKMLEREVARKNLYQRERKPKSRDIDMER